MKKEINYNDAPDFCYGEYTDGTKIEDAVLEELSGSDAKYECIYNTVY